MPPDAPDRHPFPTDFRVGDWLVEPSLDRLSRDGTVVHLRTQLMNLLVLLARNAGQTVSKQQILEAVWARQFVAESGMTRCIAELRQALDDDARDPTIVQTITKRGYRLVAPVTFLEPAEPRVATEEATAEQTASPQPEPPAGAVEEAAPAPVADPEPSPPAPAIREAVPAGRARVPSFGRASRWAAASLLSAAGVGVVVWAVAGWTRTPIITERDAVLLADFTNTTRDTAFDQALRLALKMHLGQAPFLRLVPDTNMRAALGYMGRPADQAVTGAVALEVCRREGAAVMLAGTIAPVGSHYAVGLEAVACASGESVGREVSEVASKDEVLTALGTVAGRVRRTLGESRASLRKYDVPIVQATTPSLDALRALSLGDNARDHARIEEALMSYRRATDLDPRFAVAWARRGAAAHNLSQIVADDRSGEGDEAGICFRRAYELRDRVSEAERLYILGHYYRYVEGDAQKAIETYQLWRRTYPGAVVPTNNLASIYVNTLGQYEAGLGPAREAVRLAPGSSIARGILVAASLATGRVAEAKQALAEAEAKGGTDLAWHRLAFERAFADSDTGAMRAHVQWASGDVPATMVMSEYQALAAASRGRLRDARRFWADAEKSAALMGTAGLRAGVLLRQAEAEALIGDSRAAREAAERALATDGQRTTRLAAAEVLALAGDPSRASRLLGEVAKTEGPGASSRLVWQPVVRALIAAGSGRSDEALQLLAPTARFERGRQYGLVPLGVRASIERTAGRATEAVAAYRALLELREMLPTSPWVAYARLGLARSLAEAGDVAGSRAVYDAVLAWMTGGDEDAPMLLAARRERAALPER